MKTNPRTLAYENGLDPLLDLRIVQIKVRDAQGKLETIKFFRGPLIKHSSRLASVFSTPKSYRIIKDVLIKNSKVFVVTLQTPAMEGIKLRPSYCDDEVPRLVVNGLKALVYKDLESKGYDVKEKELDDDWNLVTPKSYSWDEGYLELGNVFSKEEVVDVIRTYRFADIDKIKRLKHECICRLIGEIVRSTDDPYIDHYLKPEEVKFAYDITKAGSGLRKFLVDSVNTLSIQEIDWFKDTMSDMPKEFLVDIVVAQTEQTDRICGEPLNAWDYVK